jgi:hypothetical protein
LYCIRCHTAPLFVYPPAQGIGNNHDEADIVAGVAWRPQHVVTIVLVIWPLVEYVLPSWNPAITLIA